MSSAQLFTTKKGPLARIWLAAHWDHKLTKTHVFECNLESTVRDIISPLMKIGLRTSSHLLLGAVRIYFRKTKYLLADCNDALVKIRVAFRPDETVLAADGLEASVKAITLTEDFTAFDDTLLPDFSAIDAVDYCSLNQGRAEDITLKEDLGTQFVDLVDFSDESHIGQTGLLDMSLQSLRYYEGFGEDDKGYDFLDFLHLSGDPEESTLLLLNPDQTETPRSSALSDPPKACVPDSDRMEVEAPETMIQPANGRTFALGPVLSTSNSSRKRRKRKRKLIVDQQKELSDDVLREQLRDSSDLLVPMDLAPPTEQLMMWKKSGGACSLLAGPCSTVLAPELAEFFSEILSERNISSMCDEEEEEEEETMRHYSVKAGRRDASTPARDGSSEVNSPLECDASRDSESLTIDEVIDSVLQEAARPAAEESSSGSEGTQAELPSEDSILVQQPCRAEDSQSASLETQSMADGDASEDRKMIRGAQKLLSSLQSQASSAFSLAELCRGATRSRAAATFLYLLVLKKRNAIDVQQGAPYQDIIATRGPAFSDDFDA